MGSRCRTTSPPCNNSSLSMLSIHLYLSNTVKNPCRKTNWHSSVVHCDGNYHRNGSLGRQSNLILWSQTKKKARNGLWLIREQMDRTLPACRLASEWLNLVNFPRPVASSLSTSDGVAGFSRWLVMSGGGGSYIHATAAAAAVSEVSECGPPSRGESTLHIPSSARRLLITAVTPDG